MIKEKLKVYGKKVIIDRLTKQLEDSDSIREVIGSKGWKAIEDEIKVQMKTLIPE